MSETPGAVRADCLFGETGDLVLLGSRSLEGLNLRIDPVPLPANPATAHMFIVKPFSGQGVLGLFSTHPPTEQRIAKLTERFSGWLE